MPSRRNTLRLLGATVGAGSFAGCLSEDSDGGTSTPVGSTDSTERQTDRPSATPEPAGVGDTHSVDGVDLTLRRVAVQGSLLTVYTDSGAVTENPGGRYVLAKLSAETDSAPAAGEYALAVDGSRIEPVDPRGYFWTSPRGRRRRYTPPGAGVSEGPGGWLAFAVDGDRTAESPRLTVGDESWALPERAVERLREPAAEYDLVGLEYPETVTPEESFTVSVTAENVGSVAGTFRGVLNTSVRYASYFHPIRLTVEPGERATWELSYGAKEGLNEVGDMGGLTLESVGGDAEGSIEAVAGTAVGTATES